MKIVKQETWLPLFTGYYHSIFDESEHFIEMETDLSEYEFKEYYSELYEAGVTQKWLNENLWDYINFKDCYNACSRYIAHSLINLDHSDIIKDITYQSTVSPKYYNFSTDSINVEIEYNQEKLLNYLKENEAEFKEYISKKYTSRSGFISSYSNNHNDWLNVEMWGEHEVGSLLEFVFENNGIESIDLYDVSNVYEAFSNAVNLDYEKMIKDFKESQNKAV